MSNKYLLPLVIAILISTVVAVSVNQYFKPNNAKVAIVSSSSSSVSSKLTTGSSSAQSQISSSLVVSSEVKVAESIVAESKASEVSLISRLPSLPNIINLDCKPDIDYSSSKLPFYICDFINISDGTKLFTQKYLGYSKLGYNTKDYQEIITQNMSYGVCLFKLERFAYSTKKLSNVQDLKGCDNPDLLNELNKLKN